MTDYTALKERLHKRADKMAIEAPLADKDWHDIREAADAIATLERELAEREEERAVLWRKNRELHSTLNVEKAAITTLQSENAAARAEALEEAAEVADKVSGFAVADKFMMRDKIAQAIRALKDTPHD